MQFLAVNALEKAKRNKVVFLVTPSILALGYGARYNHTENKLVPYLR